MTHHDRMVSRRGEAAKAPGSFSSWIGRWRRRAYGRGAGPGPPRSSYRAARRIQRELIRTPEGTRLTTRRRLSAVSGSRACVRVLQQVVEPAQQVKI